MGEKKRHVRLPGKSTGLFHKVGSGIFVYNPYGQCQFNDSIKSRAETRMYLIT